MTVNTFDHLLHLAARARDGVALDAEHDQLAAGITALARQAETAGFDTAATKRLLTRRTDSLLERAKRAEDQLDTVYRERAHLVAHLAAIHPAHIGHTDPGAPEYAVLTVETPAGQMTWHIAERDMDLFAHVQSTSRICRSWDGHTTDEKYQRLRDLTTSTPTFLGHETRLDAQARHISLLEEGVTQRSALLEEARDALEAAGATEAHGGEHWPRLVPAIEQLAARIAAPPTT